MLTPQDLKAIRKDRLKDKEFWEKLRKDRLEDEDFWAKLRRDRLEDKEFWDKLRSERMKDLAHFVTRFEFNEFRNEINIKLDRIINTLMQVQDLAIDTNQTLHEYMVFNDAKVDNNKRRLDRVETVLNLN